MVEQNRIFPGCQVQGPHGELVSNPRGNKRRVREVVIGTVVEPAGEHKWTVVFDYNGEIKIVTSKSLKVVEEGTGLPLDSSSDTVSFVFFVLQIKIVQMHFYFIVLNIDLFYYFLNQISDNSKRSCGRC